MGIKPPDPGHLGRLMKRYRQQAGLSMNALARASGVDVSVVHRIERGQHARPRANTLARLAEALEVPLADLFAAAGYPTPGQLPSFSPYLRAKYRDLPPAALAKLERYFQTVQHEFGGDGQGPQDGEDEDAR